MLAGLCYWDCKRWGPGAFRQACRGELRVAACVGVAAGGVRSAFAAPPVRDAPVRGDARPAARLPPAGAREREDDAGVRVPAGRGDARGAGRGRPARMTGRLDLAESDYVCQDLDLADVEPVVRVGGLPDGLVAVPFPVRPLAAGGGRTHAVRRVDVAQDRGVVPVRHG